MLPVHPPRSTRSIRSPRGSAGSASASRPPPPRPTATSAWPRYRQRQTDEPAGPPPRPAPTGTAARAELHRPRPPAQSGTAGPQSRLRPMGRGVPRDPARRALRASGSHPWSSRRPRPPARLPGAILPSKARAGARPFSRRRSLRRWKTGDHAARPGPRCTRPRAGNPPHTAAAGAAISRGFPKANPHRLGVGRAPWRARDGRDARGRGPRPPKRSGRGTGWRQSPAGTDGRRRRRGSRRAGREPNTPQSRLSLQACSSSFPVRR